MPVSVIPESVAPRVPVAPLYVDDPTDMLYENLLVYGTTHRICPSSPLAGYIERDGRPEGYEMEIEAWIRKMLKPYKISDGCCKEMQGEWTVNQDVPQMVTFYGAKQGTAASALDAMEGGPSLAAFTVGSATVTYKARGSVSLKGDCSYTYDANADCHLRDTYDFGGSLKGELLNIALFGSYYYVEYDWKHAHSGAGTL
jgi:hypothetical protein